MFLYYEDSFQEAALKLGGAKLKAAHTVEGNLAEGLAAMEMDGGDLMDALMKTVAKSQSGHVWPGAGWKLPPSRSRDQSSSRSCYPNCCPSRSKPTWKSCGAMSAGGSSTFLGRSGGGYGDEP